MQHVRRRAIRMQTVSVNGHNRCIKYEQMFARQADDRIANASDAKSHLTS